MAGSSLRILSGVFLRWDTCGIRAWRGGLDALLCKDNKFVGAHTIRQCRRDRLSVWEYKKRKRSRVRGLKRPLYGLFTDFSPMVPSVLPSSKVRLLVTDLSTRSGVSGPGASHLGLPLPSKEGIVSSLTTCRPVFGSRGLRRCRTTKDS